MNLVYQNEKPLLVVTAVFAVVIWLALLLGTFGLVLLYLLLGYVFFLFAHSAFISHLKGTGVRISRDQYPDLYDRLLRCCEKVGLTEVPEAYLLRTDFFNALATRFRGRHFVVLFTDVVDALEERPDAIDFYIGHELGHIHRGHLIWRPMLAPAAWLPLLGPALRRAEEYTCDRYGVACCQSVDDIKAALAAIAAGDSRWKTINVDAYVGQGAATSGFWMSFNELTGDYPWLTKRMATAIAVAEERKVSHPGRNKLAWFFALFVPRLGVGGGPASLLLVVAVAGILAAVAIPQYQEYVEKARYQSAYQEGLSLTDSVEAYAAQNQSWPLSMEQLGYDAPTLENEDGNYTIDVYNGGLIGIEMDVDETGEPEYIVLEPDVTDEGVFWTCYGQNATEKFLPVDCR